MTNVKKPVGPAPEDLAPWLPIAHEAWDAIGPLVFHKPNAALLERLRCAVDRAAQYATPNREVLAEKDKLATYITGIAKDFNEPSLIPFAEVLAKPRPARTFSFPPVRAFWATFSNVVGAVDVGAVSRHHALPASASRVLLEATGNALTARPQTADELIEKLTVCAYIGAAQAAGRGIDASAETCSAMSSWLRDLGTISQPLLMEAVRQPRNWREPTGADPVTNSKRPLTADVLVRRGLRLAGPDGRACLRQDARRIDLWQGTQRRGARGAGQ
jgi:hypothetical protein